MSLNARTRDLQHPPHASGPRPLDDFDELVAVEPRLALLLRVAQAAKPRDDFEDAVLYGWLKSILTQLVGWSARTNHPLLTTQRAFDVALREVNAVRDEADV